MDADKLSIPSHIRLAGGTAVQVEFDGVRERTSAVVLGYDPDQFLILKLLGQKIHELSKLFKGNTVILRYIHEGVVYGFECQSLGSVTTPERLLFANYPTIVATQNLRQHPRQKCALPATVVIEEQEYPAACLDLSKGGAQLRFVAPPPPESAEGEDEEAAEPPELKVPEVETELGLKLTLPGQTDSTEFACIVRSVERLDDAGLIGVEYAESGGDGIAVVSGYLDALARVSEAS